MFEPKAVLRFVGILMVCFALLIAPWPGWWPTYAAYFRSFGEWVFADSSFLSPGKARFLDLASPTLFDDLDAITPGTLPRHYKLPGPEDRKDTLAVLMNKDVPQTFGVSATSSIPMGLWPTAMVAGLALATPARWRRRIVILLVGVALAHAFVALRLGLMLLKNGFADPAKSYRVFTPGESWFKVLRGADEVICDDPTFSFIAPVFIWLLVIFAVRFAGRLIGPRPTKSETSPPRPTA